MDNRKEKRGKKKEEEEKKGEIKNGSGKNKIQNKIPVTGVKHTRMGTRALSR